MKDLHIFDWSFLLNTKDNFVKHPWDYVASIKEKGDDNIKCGGQTPIWDLVLDDYHSIINIKNNYDKNDETLDLLLTKGRYDNVYLYYNNAVLALEYIGLDSGLVFKVDELKTMLFMKDFHETQGNLKLATIYKTEIDEWFENNLEVEL